MEEKNKSAAQPQGEPVPITGDMNRLMVAYKNGEFSLESGSETVEAMSVASFDTVESHGHDADSYMSGYCAAIYEQAKPFVWLALQPKAEQPAPVAVASLEIVGRQCFPSETMKKIPNYRTEPWVDGDVHQSPSVPDLYRVEPLVRLSDVTRLNLSL